MSGNSDPFRVRRRIIGRGVIYNEKFRGKWRKIVLPTEEGDHGQVRYNTLSEADWQRLTPEWAWMRKDEIEYRLLQDPNLQIH